MKEKPRQVVSGCCKQPWLANPTTPIKPYRSRDSHSQPTDRDKPCPYKKQKIAPHSGSTGSTGSA
jgi:hypothetical protein